MRLMKAIKSGDTIVVTRLDRLARSSRDLAKHHARIDGKGLRVCIAPGKLVRHHNKVGRLLMTIMGGIAQFKRELIRERCEEGIQRAMGTKFGRRNALDPSQRRGPASRQRRNGARSGRPR